jgi:uncharacterized protein (DUF433 family)
MNPIESVQTVPLTVTEDGSIEIGLSRVSLDSVVHHFKLGAAPEEIAQMYPSLQLADVYAVIAYYLNHREAIEAYLDDQEAEGEAVKAQIESQPGYQEAMKELRERLMARWSEKQRQ